MHTMQDDGHDTHDDTTNGGYVNGNGYTSMGHASKEDGKALDLRDTLLATAGMLLPLLAQLGHAH